MFFNGNLFGRLAIEDSKLAAYSNKHTTTSHEDLIFIQLIFRGGLAKHGVSKAYQAAVSASAVSTNYQKPNTCLKT